MLILSNRCKDIIFFRLAKKSVKKTLTNKKKLKVTITLSRMMVTIINKCLSVLTIKKTGLPHFCDSPAFQYLSTNIVF